jgi:hypothetical protein
MLVTASQDDAHPRVLDLLTGEEVGHLHGHVGTIKALQVEVCATGATDVQCACGTCAAWTGKLRGRSGT